MQRILLYLIFGFFLFLIINWIVNGDGYTIIEGAENNAKPPIKCPEDCASVKELQKNLSDSLKAVKVLEMQINVNTQTSLAHSKSISELNESLKEMQDNQSE
jgi:hypothetical protein